MTDQSKDLEMRARYVETLRGFREDAITEGFKSALDAAIAALSQQPSAVEGLDYTPGELDRTAPKRIWLQINTSGSNDERDEPWPGPEGVSWYDAAIGGVEVQYVRADLAPAPQPADTLDALAAAMAQDYPIAAIIRALDKQVPGIRGAFAPPAGAKPEVGS